MKLLVGYDGSAGARDALELARVLGALELSEPSSALLVAVRPYAPLPVPSAELDEAAASETDELLGEAATHLGGLEVEARSFGGGSPAGVITELAKTEDVDAIVLGGPHRGAVGRALIGSIAEGVLHGAPRAVAVAPRGYADIAREPFQRIAVAYDGTKEARAALLRAGELAEASRAAVWVMTVVAPPVAMPGAAGYTPVNPPEPERVIEEGKRAIEERAPVTGIRLDGAPAPALAKACEDDVDLLVMGSRGYGPAFRVLLGSVSTKLINSAPCPVLVVPRP